MAHSACSWCRQPLEWSAPSTCTPFCSSQCNWKWLNLNYKRTRLPAWLAARTALEQYVKKGKQHA